MRFSIFIIIISISICTGFLDNYVTLKRVRLQERLYAKGKGFGKLPNKKVQKSIKDDKVTTTAVDDSMIDSTTKQIVRESAQPDADAIFKKYGMVDKEAYINPKKSVKQQQTGERPFGAGIVDISLINKCYNSFYY